eukprot:CAMPEP_0197178540 /NCGR_PEP_ID=MMETSP1423-20130617/3791_1 /TAXON_ID=476441 /ORGANISM="Pseudo-nitzschia heimii, Strain UNC1101" /LENGTH=286 /DNA_ID=CAMNT_0042628309 /DNA_START=132 /DNA_END=992 /DNA_ORIENTATION=-
MDIIPNTHHSSLPTRRAAGSTGGSAYSGSWRTTKASREGDSTQLSIIRCYVARNGTILADATLEGYREHDPFVADTVHQLRSKRPTPGWEFASLPRWRRRACPIRLRGAKFHVYDHDFQDEDDEDDEHAFCIWSVGCVYDADALETKHVESFVRHVVEATNDLREQDIVWKTGGYLAVQHQFSPILLRMMPDAPRYAKIDELRQEVDALKDIMQDNIAKILDRDERLSDIQDLAEELTASAAVFKKNSLALKQKMRRKQLWLRATYGFATATAISAVIAVPCVVLL